MGILYLSRKKHLITMDFVWTTSTLMFLLSSKAFSLHYKIHKEVFGYKTMLLFMKLTMFPLIWISQILFTLFHSFQELIGTTIISMTITHCLLTLSKSLDLIAPLANLLRSTITTYMASMGLKWLNKFKWPLKIH